MKRYALYFLLGAAVGLFIVPSVLERLGIPSLGHWLNGLSGVSYGIAMFALGVVFLLLTIWLVKMAKRTRKENSQRL